MYKTSYYNEYRRLIQALITSCLGLSFAACCIVTFAQRPDNIRTHHRESRRADENNFRPDPSLSPDQQRGQQLMGLYLQSGIRKPYQGDQTTRILSGKLRESRQIVKHAGPGRERIEYISPESLKGEIILMNGWEIMHYRTHPQPKIYDGFAPMGDLMRQTHTLLRDVRNGKVDVRAVGTQIIAGQNAAIVEIRPVKGGAAFKRVWLDQNTGVRLKMEDVNSQGNVISTSYFNSINYSPNFDPKDFKPEALPSVPHEPLLPRSKPLGSVQDAQTQAGFNVREPAVKPGFHLSGAWVVNGSGTSHAVILRYTDGVNTFALFQQPIPLRFRKDEDHIKKLNTRAGIAHWQTEDQIFTLIGNLRRETVEGIYQSLR